MGSVVSFFALPAKRWSVEGLFRATEQYSIALSNYNGTNIVSYLIICAAASQHYKSDKLQIPALFSYLDHASEATEEVILVRDNNPPRLVETKGLSARFPITISPVVFSPPRPVSVKTQRGVSTNRSSRSQKDGGDGKWSTLLRLAIIPYESSEKCLLSISQLFFTFYT
jgi:hypothetical protein